MRGLLFLLFPVLALAATTGSEPATATVLAPVANLFSGPSSDKDVVSQAIYATTVGIVERQAEWVKVRTPDDYTGWMLQANVRMNAPGEQPYASQGKAVEVRSLFCHVYREPTLTKHMPLVTVPFETRLELVRETPEENGRWLQVRLPDDRPAWVQRGDISAQQTTMTIRQMIEFSRRFLGLPYTWGGVSSYGYDCSGFTQMLCRQRGISLPRDAGPQAHCDKVTEVRKDDLQPGDLLYFGSSPDKITHTGMYIGDGQFIHATTHDRPMIQISKLSEPHWTELLVACRRPK